MVTGIRKRTLTLKEAAELLGVSTRVLRKAIGRGQITGFRVGHAFVIPRAPLEALLGSPGPLQLLESDEEPLGRA